MRYADYNGNPEVNMLQVEYNKITIFDNLWFDLSTFKYYNFGSVYASYYPAS